MSFMLNVLLTKHPQFGVLRHTLGTLRPSLRSWFWYLGWGFKDFDFYPLGNDPIWPTFFNSVGFNHPLDMFQSFFQPRVRFIQLVLIQSWMCMKGHEHTDISKNHGWQVGAYKTWVTSMGEYRSADTPFQWKVLHSKTWNLLMSQILHPPMFEQKSSWTFDPFWNWPFL